MSDTRPTVLITGANGFVGSRLCRAFSQKGYRVFTGVRKTADLKLLADITCEHRYGDVTHTNSLPAMVSGVDYIIHNAGLVKANSKEQLFAVNETGTANLFAAIAVHNPNVKKVVYISSLAAGGPSYNGVPVREEGEPNPITGYGESKLAGEKVAFSYADRFHVVSLRPAGVYGPGDKEIFTFFQTVNNHIKPFLGDTSRKIQLVHVDDLCRAVRLAIEKDAKRGQVYFIAEKTAYSLKQLVELLVKASGGWAVPLFVPGFLLKVIAAIAQGSLKLVGKVPMLTPEKAGELLSSWEVSTEKAKRDFGFESEIAFPNGARETFAWYREKGWL